MNLPKHSLFVQEKIKTSYMDFFSLSVQKVIRETPSTKTFEFLVPAALREQFKYEPGQYITLRFFLHGREERRPYSMSSNPFKDESLAVTVKKLDGGVVSTHLHDHVTEGDTVEVAPPEGHFTISIAAGQRKAYYLFGAGSGITPLKSHISAILEEEPKSVIYLLYGSRNENEIIFKNALDSWEAHYADQIHVEHTLSQAIGKKKVIGSLFGGKKQAIWTGGTGRISKKKVEQFLRKFEAENHEKVFLLCGPTEMMAVVEEALTALQIDPKTIHKEYFTSAHGQAESTGPSLSGKGKLITHLDGSTLESEISKKDTILDHLIQLGFDPPYSCTSGSCASCMAKILNGKVDMDVSLGLDKEEIDEGYILTCQAKLISDEVEITYED